MTSSTTTSFPQSDATKLDAALAKAMELQLAGQLEGAEQIYRAILKVVPQHNATNYCLGMLHVQLQRSADGLPYLKAALLTQLEVPDYWLGYLEALLLNGSTTAARNILDLGRQHGLAGPAVEDFAKRLEALPRTGSERSELRATEKWQTIPIILNNRNRFDSLSRMVDWLLTVGCRDIRILDNDSAYEPLLAYYDALPEHVSVQRLGENIGPWAFWKLGLHRQMATPYIVSDADLVPADFCPEDLISHLADVANRFPDCGKVAPGLRLDAISPGYGQSAAAFQWESRFWSKPVAPGLFAAPVDTTFALYQPGVEFAIRRENLRLGYPYLLEHTPWQVDEGALGAEEMFYRAHTSKTFSHWSSSTIDPRIAANKWITQFSVRKTVLHLGCGNNYIPGWINIDVNARKCDIRFDFENCRSQRLPLADDSVDGFYLCHVFNRVKDTLALMEELYRVAKHDATIHIRLPYGSSNDAWDDPAAARPYFETSFMHFSQPAQSRTYGEYAADWQPKRLTLVVEPPLFAQGLEAAMRQIRSSRNLVSEMVVELSAVKPARPRLCSLPTNGQILLCTDPRIPPSFNEMDTL